MHSISYMVITKLLLLMRCVLRQKKVGCARAEEDWLAIKYQICSTDEDSCIVLPPDSPNAAVCA